jgi:hypothetical protein
MSETTAIQRQAGYSRALARAYEHLDKRDPRELIVRGKGSSPKQPLVAFFDDALIIAEEVGLPVAADQVNGLNRPMVEIPPACVQRLMELPHRIRIVRTLVSKQGSVKKVEYLHEVYACGNLLFSAMAVKDASPASGAATTPEGTSSRLADGQQRQSTRQRTVAARLRYEERAQTK